MPKMKSMRSMRTAQAYEECCKNDANGAHAPKVFKGVNSKIRYCSSPRDEEAFLTITRARGEESVGDAESMTRDTRELFSELQEQFNKWNSIQSRVKTMRKNM